MKFGLGLSRLSTLLGALNGPLSNADGVKPLGSRSSLAVSVSFCSRGGGSKSQLPEARKRAKVLARGEGLHNSKQQATNPKHSLEIKGFSSHSKGSQLPWMSILH